MPPWCSLGRAHERRKSRKVIPAYNFKSFCLERENNAKCKADNEDDSFEMLKTETVKKSSKTLIKRSKSRTANLLLFFMLALGFTCQYLKPDILSRSFSIKILAKTIYTSYLGTETTPVNEECCHRMKHLALALNRAEQALRALRYRKTIYTLKNFNAESAQVRSEIGYIEGALAVIGKNTTEWGGNVALWGIIPLWRAAPPPNTILKLRRPTPSDCWPLKGQYGEVVIDLPKKIAIAKISVEHIRPDTARSAPKHFIVFGILGNGTWIKAADGIYEYNKPAKQYFNLDNRNIPFQQIVFRVLSNQGNMKYTCIYRVRIYASNYNLLSNKLF